jgi:hypothetical protein
MGSSISSIFTKSKILPFIDPTISYTLDLHQDIDSCRPNIVHPSSWERQYATLENYLEL